MKGLDYLNSLIQLLDRIEQESSTIYEAIAKVEDAITETRIVHFDYPDSPATVLYRETLQGILALMQKPEKGTPGITAEEVHASLHEKIMKRPSLVVDPDIGETAKQIFEQSIKLWASLDPRERNFFQRFADAINGVLVEGREELVSLYQELLKVLEG